MKELITNYIQLANSGVRIRFLTLGELLNLMYGLDEHLKWLDETDNLATYEAFKNTRKLKKYAKKVLKYATNVKRPKVKHFFLIDVIVNVNLGIEQNEEAPADKSSKTNVFKLVDLLASEYGWTDKYILNNITFEQAKIYAEIIHQRNEKAFAKKVIAVAYAMHDPEGDVVKNAVKIFTGKSRKHVRNVRDYIEKLREEQTNG